MRATEPTVRLLCSCGHSYIASARQARRIRCGQVQARCRTCRNHAARKPIDELKTPQLREARMPITDRDRMWWLARMSLEELVDIVCVLHGEVGAAALERWQSLCVEVTAQEELDLELLIDELVA